VWHRVARRMIGIRLLDALADILPFALIAGAVMGVTWFATQGITNLKLLIIAKILLAAVLYIVVMLAARVRIFAESFGFLLQKFGIKSKHLS
jgi:hypothetical protein